MRNTSSTSAGDQDDAVHQQAVPPPFQHGLVILEDGPDRGEEQDNSQQREEVCDALVGTGEGLDVFANGHGAILRRLEPGRAGRLLRKAAHRRTA